MAEKKVSNNMVKVLNMGMHDALINGDIVRDIQTRFVFVSSQSELAEFTDIEPVGTVAALYGFGSMWQLKPDRTWESI